MTSQKYWLMRSVFILMVGLAVTVCAPYPAVSQTTPETAETQRAREAEQARQSEQIRQSERTRDAERARMREDSPYERRVEHERPGEMYVAGFGGYTFGHTLSGPQGNGAIAGATFGGTGVDLKDSGVYGAKIGYFLPDRWNWLGMEVEAFNTTPHIKEHPEGGTQAISEGSNLRVTTVAFNLIARGKFACHSRQDRDHPRRTVDTRSEAYRDDEWCPLQPYAGVGLGLFFARAKDRDGSSSDNAVPGLNALVGVRYFFTERIAMFGEYKYNRATFNFDQIDNGPAGRAGFNGDYSVSHVVAGLSFHF